MKIKTTKKALQNVHRCDTSWMWEREKREASMSNSEKKFVLQQWELHFKTDPPESVSWILLKEKLAYHIAHEENLVKGRVESDKFKRNYKAAMELDLQGFHPDSRYLLELSMKYKGVSPEKEQEMKAKKKQAGAKAAATRKAREGNKGPKKGETWHGLLSANFSKKLTDEELAAAMTKAMGTGEKFTTDQVIKARGFFNFGALSPKLDKPKTALKQYRDGKEVEPKPRGKKAKAKK